MLRRAHTDKAFIIDRLNKNISMRSVARFEHSIEENGHYSKEHPDMIGFSLNAIGQKTVSHRYELLKAMKERVKTFGTVVGENKNSLLVDCGKDRMVCVAFDGNNILYLIGPRSELNYSLDDVFPDEPNDDQYMPVEAYILAVG